MYERLLNYVDTKALLVLRSGLYVVEFVNAAKNARLIACKSDLAKLPKINFLVALLTENSRPVLPF